jgi:hypothetical protein
VGVARPAGAPAPVADTLATAPLDDAIAASRSGAASLANGQPLRLELSGRGARGFVWMTYFAGRLQPDPFVYGLTGDLYFTLLAAAPDSTATAVAP